MNDIVVLAEEASGQIVAQQIARAMGLESRVLCLAHEGRSDLEKSFPRKMQAWSGHPRFIVMRDNDGANCVEKKAALARLVPSSAAGRVKIRLVCQELESWYIGDPEALRQAGLIDAALARSWSKKKEFRDPDQIRHAKEKFRRAVGEWGQTEMARRVGSCLDPVRNLSPSFRAFVNALRWAAAG